MEIKLAVGSGWCVCTLGCWICNQQWLLQPEQRNSSPVCFIPILGLAHSPSSHEALLCVAIMKSMTGTNPNFLEIYTCNYIWVSTKMCSLSDYWPSGVCSKSGLGECDFLATGQQFKT